MFRVQLLYMDWSQLHTQQRMCLRNPVHSPYTQVCSHFLLSVLGRKLWRYAVPKLTLHSVTRVSKRNWKTAGRLRWQRELRLTSVWHAFCFHKAGDDSDLFLLAQCIAGVTFPCQSKPITKQAQLSTHFISEELKETFDTQFLI